jgi:phosphatidylinositol alpha-1,6-mannosyltransferase
MPPNESKPKVMLITRNLPPLVGGMERLMHNLVTGLAGYATVTVLGPTGCADFLPKNLVVHEFPEKLVPFISRSTWRAVRLCRQNHFDIIIGGSGLVSPTLRVLRLLYGCKTLAYLHGLDLVVNSIIYQSVFTPCHRKLSHAVVNSTNTLKLAIEKGIARERLSVVNPGTNLPLLPSDQVLNSFRERHDIFFDKLIVFVGRITKRKGLSAFIKYSLPKILESESRAGLIVIGNDAQDSLSQLGEHSEVMDLISKLEQRERVLFLGKLNDEDLNICYAASDVQIFPLVDIPGDVEGFGMVAIEAAACGTPTVAFDLGGVSDAISGDNGHLVTAGQYHQFTDAVLTILKSGNPSSLQCIEHGKKYSWDIFNRNIKHEVLRLAKT